jgi:hypothetical protein
MIALGFSLSGRNHLLGGGQGEHLLFRKLCGRMLRRNRKRCENQCKSNCFSHVAQAAMLASPGVIVTRGLLLLAHRHARRRILRSCAFPPA